MARTKPELFYAYVGIGQVADFPIKSDSATYAIEELSHVGPPPYNSGEGFRVQHKWANAFEGADEFLYGTLGLALVAPGYSVQDINDSGDRQILSADRLVPETQSIGPAELGPEFSIPMFVFQGEEDFTTSTALARHYAESIKALRKEFVRSRVVDSLRCSYAPISFCRNPLCGSARSLSGTDLDSATVCRIESGLHSLRRKS